MLSTAILGLNPLPSVAATGPAVALYGQSGTFGGLTNKSSLSSGHSFGAKAVPGWGPTAGHSFFYGTAQGGEIILGGFPQTSNALNPTADHMLLSTFKPSGNRYRNLVVPTSNGSPSAVNPYNGLVGGADVSDLQMVTIRGVRKLAFTATTPYHRWAVPEKGIYPSLGFLKQDGKGNWIYDAASSKTAYQLQKINGEAGKEVFPTGQNADPSAPHYDTYSFSMVPYAELGEMALAPRSKYLVINRYLAGDFVVLDAGGRLKGYYKLPEILDLNGGKWAVAPKSIEADPSSNFGDERLLVSYDAYYTAADGTQSWHYPVQEFRFNANEADYTKAMRPVSAAFYDDKGQPHAGLTYDANGNLWIGSTGRGGYGFSGGDVVIYRKDPRSGRRPWDAGVCALPADWPARGWGINCTADVARITGSTSDGWATNIAEDTKTSMIYVTTVLGRVLPIVPTYRAGYVVGGTRKTTIELDAGALRATQQPSGLVWTGKGHIDVARRALWVPARTDWANYPSAKSPEKLSQWAYRINLELIK